MVDIDSEESVDMCPDPTGAVPVKVHSVFTLITDTETVTATIAGTFTGQTDAQGNLASTTGHATVEGETNSGSTTSDDYGATMDGITLSGGGKATGGTWQGTGDGVIQAVGAAALDIESSVPAILSSAQRAWQDSGCVALEAPDLNGRASFGDNGNASAHKDVEVMSKTDFTVQVHDRFRHANVNLPMTMKLTTKESIDPTTVESLPQSVTYEAPGQPDQTNAVVLESKSLQGSTKLTLHFRTKQPTLVLSMNGTLLDRVNAGANTTVTITLPKTALDEHGFENSETPITYGNASATGHLRFIPKTRGLPCVAVTGTESGGMPLIATFATADDGTSTWSIHADQSEAHFKTVDRCGRKQVKDFGAGGGGYIPKAFMALGTFTVPAEPGTYPVSGNRATSSGSDAATMSVTVYPAPKPTK
jgi:hypothetical protein